MGFVCWRPLADSYWYHMAVAQQHGLILGFVAGAHQQGVALGCVAGAHQQVNILGPIAVAQQQLFTLGCVADAHHQVVALGFVPSPSSKVMLDQCCCPAAGSFWDDCGSLAGSEVWLCCCDPRQQSFQRETSQTTTQTKDWTPRSFVLLSP